MKAFGLFLPEEEKLQVKNLHFIPKTRVKMYYGETSQIPSIKMNLALLNVQISAIEIQ